MVRALQRGIDPDLLENLLRKGKIKRYGNDGIKFISKGSKRTITCVGQVIGTKIVIFTIEKGN
ncbi:hypothetical protein HYV85_05675 [Candidatus Woesearchaeota archaeon]|nr:hypothetical protein [Candidatus Woesearchaeota archaeon]